MGLAFLITTENLQLLSERKVLKESEYAALLDAGEVLDTAREEANRIVTQARAEAEAASDRGYEEGLLRGQADAAQQLLSQAESNARQLQALRGAMAQIVVKAVGHFIADAAPAALFEAALVRIDSLIRSEPFVTVRVPPVHEAVVRAVIQRLAISANWQMQVALSVDPSLASGACVVQTGSGTLEIGVDAQLDAVRRAIELGGASNPGGAGT